MLSFDIETDPKGSRLLAISMYAPGIDEVLIVDGSGRPCPRVRSPAPTNTPRSRHSANASARFDPDVITGWNIIDFDLSVLERIAARVGHPFDFGRDAGALRIRKAEGYFGSGQATIPGRVVLDGIDLLRGAFVRMEDYSLDAVSRAVLGEGKAVKGDVKDRLAEIIHNYRYDLPAFALYARTDSRLAYDIVHKLDLVRLAFARSQLAGMTPDRVAASIASFDFVYLSELEKRRIVAPTVRSGDSSVYAAQQGGYVLEPESGPHRNVGVRLQESVSERHSHVQHRSAVVRSLSLRLAKISFRHQAERSVASRRSCLDCSTSCSLGARPLRRRGTRWRRTPSRSS